MSKLSNEQIERYLKELSDEENDNLDRISDLDESENDLSEEEIEFEDCSDESEIDGENFDRSGCSTARRYKTLCSFCDIIMIIFSVINKYLKKKNNDVKYRCQ